MKRIYGIPSKPIIGSFEPLHDMICPAMYGIRPFRKRFMDLRIFFREVENVRHTIFRGFFYQDPSIKDRVFLWSLDSLLDAWKKRLHCILRAF